MLSKCFAILVGSLCEISLLKLVGKSVNNKRPTGQQTRHEETRQKRSRQEIKTNEIKRTAWSSRVRMEEARRGESAAGVPRQRRAAENNSRKQQHTKLRTETQNKAKQDKTTSVLFLFPVLLFFYETRAP